jgi:peptidoglycan hydrolase-like protein with peptidoglycan-binding domain
VGSQGIDWGTTCNVSQSSYRYSRLTGGIQRWLNQLGFGCGGADAIFGAMTTACVKEFQWVVMNRGPQQQTGLVDAGTWHDGVVASPSNLSGHRRL